MTDLFMTWDFAQIGFYGSGAIMSMGVFGAFSPHLDAKSRDAGLWLGIVGFFGFCFFGMNL